MCGRFAGAVAVGRYNLEQAGKASWDRGLQDLVLFGFVVVSNIFPLYFSYRNIISLSSDQKVTVLLRRLLQRVTHRDG